MTVTRALPTRAALLERHHAVAQELKDLRRMLGLSLEAEKDTKVRSFEAGAQLRTDKQREQRASLAALEHSKGSIILKSEIESLEEERDDIRVQLTYGGYQEAD